MEANSGKEDNSMMYAESSADDRMLAINSALDILENERNLLCLDTLGKGSYGDVFLVYDTKTQVQKAAKIVMSRNVIPFELIIWPKLNHENVLCIEELIEMADKTITFLMPLKFKALNKIIRSGEFKDYQQNFEALKVWLRNALNGIEYIHKHEYCHFDIKLDNVLVGHDGRACLCDFSFINHQDHPVSFYSLGLPDIYKPPEAFSKEGKKSMSGVIIDMWAYGMMILEASTDFYILNNVDKCQNWILEIKPVLETILEPDTFHTHVRSTYFNYNFAELGLHTLLGFIEAFLKEQPELRMSACEALEHPFFLDISDFVVNMADIYSEEELHPNYETDDGEDLKELEQTKKTDSEFIATFQPNKKCATNPRAARRKECLIYSKTKALFKVKHRMKIREPYKVRLQKLLVERSHLHDILKEYEKTKLENAGDENQVNEEEYSQLTYFLLESEEQEKIEIETEKIKQEDACEANTSASAFHSQEESEKLKEDSTLSENPVSVLQNSFFSNEIVEKNSDQSPMETVITTQKDIKITPNEVISNGSELSETNEETSTFCSWLAGTWNTICGAICPVCVCTG